MSTTAEHLRHADDASLLDLRVRDQLNEAWLVTVLLDRPPPRTRHRRLRS